MTSLFVWVPRADRSPGSTRWAVLPTRWLGSLLWTSSGVLWAWPDAHRRGKGTTSERLRALLRSTTDTLRGGFAIISWQGRLALHVEPSEGEPKAVADFHCRLAVLLDELNSESGVPDAPPGLLVAEVTNRLCDLDESEGKWQEWQRRRRWRVADSRLLRRFRSTGTYEVRVDRAPVWKKFLRNRSGIAPGPPVAGAWGRVWWIVETVAAAAVALALLLGVLGVRAGGRLDWVVDGHALHVLLITGALAIAALVHIAVARSAYLLAFDRFEDGHRLGSNDAIYPFFYGAALDAARRYYGAGGRVVVRARARWLLPWRLHTVELTADAPADLVLYANSLGTWLADRDVSRLLGSGAPMLAELERLCSAPVHVSVSGGALRIAVHGRASVAALVSRLVHAAPLVQQLLLKHGAQVEPGYRERRADPYEDPALRRAVNRTCILTSGCEAPRDWKLAAGRRCVWKREDLALRRARGRDSSKAEVQRHERSTG